MKIFAWCKPLQACTCLLLFTCFILLPPPPSDAKIKKIKTIKKLLMAKLLMKPLMKSGMFKAPMFHFVMPMGSGFGLGMLASDSSSSSSSSSIRSPQEILQNLFSLSQSGSSSDGGGGGGGGGSSGLKLHTLVGRIFGKARRGESGNGGGGGGSGGGSSSSSSSSGGSSRDCAPAQMPINCSPVNCVPSEMMENEIQQQMDRSKGLKDLLSLAGYGSQTSESNAEGTLAEMPIPAPGSSDFVWPTEMYDGNPATTGSTDSISHSPPDHYQSQNFAYGRETRNSYDKPIEQQSYQAKSHHEQIQQAASSSNINSNIFFDIRPDNIEY